MDKKIELFSLTWPLFIENLLRFSLGNVNIFMLSLFSDRTVSAVGVSNDIMRMVLLIYSIIGVGTSVIINQYLGSGQKQAAGKVATVAIVSNLLFGLLLSLMVSSLAPNILRWMNLPKELMGYGIPYLTIVGFASFTQALMSTMSGIFRSHGYTKFSMYMATMMNGMNIIGNYIIIFHPMGIPVYGVTGIAWSLVLSEVITTVIMLTVLFRRIQLAVRWKDFVPFPTDILKGIMKIGLPSAGEYLSYNGSQLATTFIVIMLGTYALATKIYTQNIMYFVWMIGLSVGQGTMILVGHKVGAKKNDDAYQCAIRNLRLSILVDVSLAIVVALLGGRILHIFTSNHSILATGVKLLFITILLEPGRAFNLVIGNALRGAGDVKYPVVMGILSMWLVGVPLCYLLGIHWKLGLVGIWMAFTVDEWTRGLILYFRWKTNIWRSKSLVGKGYLEIERQSIN
jgi:putative MATE family efflux protein